MTYGYWLARARVHLGETLDAMADSGPSAAADILSMTGSRAKVYQQLARHAELLIDSGSKSLRDLAPTTDLAAFRRGLRSAADHAIAPGPIASTSPPVRSLIAAADSLGVAGDILASHLHSGRRTPEGIAIRAGGGVVPAAVQLARVASDVLAIDLAVTGWLERADDAWRAVAQPLVDATHRTTSGTMPSMLGEVRSITPSGPALLTDLMAVPAVDRPDVDIHTTADAAACLRAARTWLWRNPDLFRVVHLRLGTQLGLAAAILSDLGERDRGPAARAWRQAATLASALEGSRPSEDAIPAARRLGDVLGWARSTLQSDIPVDVSAITDQLRSLAQTLATGTAHAVERSDIFVHQTELRRVRPGIIRPTSTWHPAKLTDHEIGDLCNALATLGREPRLVGTSSAGRAFPRPQQAAAPRAQPPAVPAIAPAGPHRRLTR